MNTFYNCEHYPINYNCILKTIDRLSRAVCDIFCHFKLNLCYLLHCSAILVSYFKEEKKNILKSVLNRFPL